MKELKEKNAQLQQQLEAASALIHELQMKSQYSQDPPQADDSKYMYSLIRYVNIPRELMQAGYQQCTFASQKE